MYVTVCVCMCVCVAWGGLIEKKGSGGKGRELRSADGKNLTEISYIYMTLSIN